MDPVQQVRALESRSLEVHHQSIKPSSHAELEIQVRFEFFLQHSREILKMTEAVAFTVHLNA